MRIGYFEDGCTILINLLLNGRRFHTTILMVLIRENPYIGALEKSRFNQVQ